MPLNIKDEAVYRQARQLATLTGQTGAVREAIAERLREVAHERKQTPIVRSPEMLLALAREIAPYRKDGERSADRADLYDEDGLPLLFKGDDFSHTDVTAAT